MERHQQSVHGSDDDSESSSSDEEETYEFSGNTILKEHCVSLLKRIYKAQLGQRELTIKDFKDLVGFLDEGTNDSDEESDDDQDASDDGKKIFTFIFISTILQAS